MYDDPVMVCGAAGSVGAAGAGVGAGGVEPISKVSLHFHIGC